MSLATAFAPLFVQVALTFALLFWMAFARIGVIKRKAAKMADIALGQPNWPPKVQQIGNSYHSQFQIPLLFYVLVALAILTKSADLLFVVMSWAFVLTRLLLRRALTRTAQARRTSARGRRERRPDRDP